MRCPASQGIDPVAQRTGTAKMCARARARTRARARVCVCVYFEGALTWMGFEAKRKTTILEVF